MSDQCPNCGIFFSDSTVARMNHIERGTMSNKSKYPTVEEAEALAAIAGCDTAKIMEESLLQRHEEALRDNLPRPRTIADMAASHVIEKPKCNVSHVIEKVKAFFESDDGNTLIPFSHIEKANMNPFSKKVYIWTAASTEEEQCVLSKDDEATRFLSEYRAWLDKGE